MTGAKIEKTFKYRWYALQKRTAADRFRHLFFPVAFVVFLSSLAREVITVSPLPAQCFSRL